MTPSDLLQMLDIAMDAGTPAHVWGAPGIGKSDIIRALAAAKGIDMIDLRALLLDPVDLRGLPRIDGNLTRWIPPEFFPQGGKGILFLDELTAAPQMVQAACYSLVLDRKVGNYTLPDGWHIMAAGNRVSDHGVHFSMPDPLRSRFVHYTLEPDLKDWCQWALVHNIRPEIIAFLRFKPSLLLGEHKRDEYAWASPRAWVNLSRQIEKYFLKFTELDTRFANMCTGAVGEGASGEFTGFMRLYSSLPSIDDILLNPTTAPVPSKKDVSAAIAVATALGRRITDRNIAQAVKYLDRMEPEYHVLAMRDASRRDSLVTKTKAFTDFSIRFADVMGAAA